MFSHFNFRYATFLTTFLNFQALGSGTFHVRWYKNLDKALEFSRLKFELGLHERRFGGVDFIARKRGNVVLIFFSREIFT